MIRFKVFSRAVDVNSRAGKKKCHKNPEWKQEVIEGVLQG